MSLTTMLLADAAVSKGGPGSGPHTGGLSTSQSAKAAQARKATIRADKASVSAHSPESHREAAAAHEKAASVHNDASQTSMTPQLYQAHVNYHNQMAESHRASAQ